MPTESLPHPVNHAAPPVAEKFYIRHRPWLVMAVIVVFAAIVRIRLLQIPLERDEGEFAYMGQLLLQGIPPYLIAYNMKLAGMYAAYAGIMAVFGQTVAAIHLGLLIVNAAAVVLLFLLARRLFDDIAGVAAAAGYALLSLSPNVLGTAAHATQFIVPLALGGTLLLLKAVETEKYPMIFAAGLLYGLALMVKQHAVFFILFAGIYFPAAMIRKQKTDWKKLASGIAVLLAASVIPFAVSCLALYFAGVFPRFWFWTFTYAHQYVSEVSLHQALERLLSSAARIMESWEGLWILAGVGLTATFWNEKAKASRFFLWGFLLCSFLTICPGFFFREHYYVTLLPAVALSAGVAISALVRFLSARNLPFAVKMLPIFIFAAALIFPVYKNSGFFFGASPDEACRMIYNVNPFPESLEIGGYIKDHSNEDDKIAVLGSEPQICFYANRKSATGYMYVYGLMENQDFASKMQQEMISEIEAAQPKYIVFVKVPSSWLVRRTSDLTILQWSDGYLKQNYRPVGAVDIFEDGYKAYWEQELLNYQPASRYNVYVLERIVKPF